jgi:hypothetical protein
MTFRLGFRLQASGFRDGEASASGFRLSSGMGLFYIIVLIRASMMAKTLYFIIGS